jgi:tetratricopeptide (TPR) repeat protein
VIEPAAVVGPVFEWSAVAELVPAALSDRLAAHLQALVRRDLVCPAESGFASEDAFAFSHGLIRDAAYGGLPKEVRAELHEKYSRWLERKAAGSTGEYEELIGYHLEQAVQYRRDLARLDERTDILAYQAGQLLSLAGKRALGRGDAPAAAKLLERATSLLGSRPERAQVMLELALALRDLGELVRAETVIEDARGAAHAGGDVRLEARAQLERAVLHIYTSPGQTTDEILHLVNRVVPVLEQTGDDEGLAKAWYLVGAVHWTGCRAGAMEDVLERALGHARRAGSQRELAFVLNGLARAMLVGPTSVDVALRRCTEILEEAAGDRTQRAIVSIWVAILEAMHGEFERARSLCAESGAILEELGQKLRAVAAQGYVGTIELLAGDLVTAEGLFRSALEALEPLGERPNRRNIAARLAEVLAQLGRVDEAEHLAQLSRETAPPDDVATQVRWRIALATALARRTEHAGAEQLAREAISVAEETDWLNMRGDAQMCLAEILAAAGKDLEARVAAHDAARLYEAKGNLVSADRARAAGGLTAAASGADRRP